MLIMSCENPQYQVMHSFLNLVQLKPLEVFYRNYTQIYMYFFFLFFQYNVEKIVNYLIARVVRRFLSRRFHPKSRWLFPFYSSSITLGTDLLTFGVMGAIFKITGEMRRFLAYFYNPDLRGIDQSRIFCQVFFGIYI